MRPQITASSTPRGLEVASPYGSDVTMILKESGGRWDPAARVWVVPVESAEPVLARIQERFGRIDSTDTVLVELRPLEEKVATRVHWGPWWLAAGQPYGSALTAGVVAVAGSAKNTNRGSKRSPSYYVVLSPDTVLRLVVPRDWFEKRDPAVDAGWIVREIPVPSVVTLDASASPAHIAPLAPPVDALASSTTNDLLREVRTRVAQAMDAQRRVPGAESAAQLDRLGTLLAAIEGVL